MTSRKDRPDTNADIELKECLVPQARRSFVMVAGAGSGKTTSLVKALATVVAAHGKALKRERRQVACITYTEIAAAEIWADVGNDPLVHVSTIHSFLWAVSRTFQADIRGWTVRHLEGRLGKLRAEAASFGPRVRQRARDKNARDVEKLVQARLSLVGVSEFKYGSGSDYSNGILGHDDIIRMATDLLLERRLLRTILSHRFPFVFVDESQDTQEPVVAALKAVASQAGSTFCLGFFGDPMQKIYLAGVGPVAAETGWASIEKEENFRCPAAVLAVANAVRRDGDGLVQTRGRAEMADGQARPVAGTARMFVLPADGRRDALLRRVRDFVAKESRDSGWIDDAADLKTLVVVHRMAATRLGFAHIYAAMNDKAPPAFSEGLLDGTAWPLRPLLSFAVPMAAAVAAGHEFDAMTLLRKHSPALVDPVDAGVPLTQRLRKLRTAASRVHGLLDPASGGTIRDVLTLMRHELLVVLDQRILPYLEDRDLAGDVQDDDGEDDVSREIASMGALLACPAAELHSYCAYIRRLSPFATQQGIKGTEFERVLVILDDEEGTHVQFSYDKYFGVKAPTKADIENERGGKETSVERTRRLFYVCCTRATSGLAVVYFASDPAAAEARVRSMHLFPDGDVHNLATLP